MNKAKTFIRRFRRFNRLKAKTKALFSLLRTICVICVICGSSAFAQTQVTITDTLKNADATNAAGRIVISWDPFTTAAGVTVAGGTKTYTVTAGAISLTLTPNTGATPAGTSYKARYYLTNGASYTETWVIPASGPVTINAIRVSIVPSPTVLFNPLTQLYKSGILQGDLLTGSATLGYVTRLAIGTNGQCLTSNGTTAVWGSCALTTAPAKEINIRAACDNATAGPIFDRPTAGATTATCFGTTTTQGAENFVDAATTGGSIHFRLPTGWTGNLDIKLGWFANAASANAVRWSVATGCVADSEAISTGPSYNAASATNAAYTGTANQRQTTTLSAVATTNCSAGETIYVQVQRIGADAGDTLAATAELLEITVVIRVTPQA